MRHRVLFLLVILLIVLYCDACQHYPSEPGAHIIQPDSMFAPLWAQVEACAHAKRDMREIDFYAIPGVMVFGLDGKLVAGYYRNPNQIVMGEEGYYYDSWLRHEMLHAILRSTVHEPEFFGACKDIVSPP